MSRFAERSNQSELIDEPGIPFQDWEVCLRELDQVNTWLGGHAITLEGVNKLIAVAGEKLTNQPLVIAEIGCGGGDNLKAIYRHLRDRPAHFIGIDLNEACTRYAKKNCKEIPSAEFIHSDYRDVSFRDRKPHIIFNSLFCHHFRNDQLVTMLQWMRGNSELGFFINDLQRHPVAFHSIAVITKLFSRSYLVKNDAPISVSRGFRKKDWIGIFDAANIHHYTIHWRWAFRYLVMCLHE